MGRRPRVRPGGAPRVRRDPSPHRARRASSPHRRPQERSREQPARPGPRLTSARVSRPRVPRRRRGRRGRRAPRRCSIKGSAASLAEHPVDWQRFWADAKATKQLNFANWPLYIDSDKGKSESLRLFEQATGIAVDYQAVIQDNATFYATVSPILRAQGATGYDLVVMTNGFELTQMIKNGFVCELDHSRLPNFREVRRGLRQGPDLRPGQQALRGLADRVHRASPTTRSTSTARSRPSRTSSTRRSAGGSA